MRIEVAAIDTGGHFTDEVYNYVREGNKVRNDKQIKRYKAKLRQRCNF